VRPRSSSYAQANLIRPGDRLVRPRAINATVDADPTGELTLARDQFSHALPSLLAIRLGPSQQP
jgi:hypothetical protein